MDHEDVQRMTESKNSKQYNERKLSSKIQRAKRNNKREIKLHFKLFIHKMRRIDAQKYPRDISKQLRYLQVFQFFFRNTLGKSLSFFTDKEFMNSRNSLEAAMKQPCEENRGVRKRKASVISTKDESLL